MSQAQLFSSIKAEGKNDMAGSTMPLRSESRSRTNPNCAAWLTTVVTRWRHLSMIAIVSAGCCGGCVDQGGQTEAQRAYNACTSDWNNTIRHLSGYKAAVSGVGPNGTSCFWSWNAPSPQVALSRASANCNRAYSRCFTYYSGSGFSAWEQWINNHGGNDPNNAQGSASNDDSEALEALFGGLSAGRLSRWRSHNDLHDSSPSQLRWRRRR